MDYELRINTALGKILRYFNFIELNLGLCLRSLANPTEIEASHSFLYRSGMPATISRLHKLIIECPGISESSAFEKWMIRAEEIRPLRNFYVHATWDYLPLNKEHPLLFTIPPWRIREIEKPKKWMDIEDLERDAEKIKTVFEEFMSIRQLYGI